jgi:uncharacterized damage-inducible protein DinB
MVHMSVKDLETMFDYGYWANRKLFDVVSQLTLAQFTHDGSCAERRVGLA